MTEHHLTVERTARYYTIGSLTDATTHVWFCLHGFGQLARYFGQKFTGLANDQTFVVVPEGLSRMYLNGQYERVGASWLTREDKVHEISDLLRYLDTLYDQVLSGRDPADLYVTLLGFSQGAAVACRWLANGRIRADRLVLWAGFFPNGLGDVIQPTKLTNVETHYLYGRQDEFIRQIPDIEKYLHRLRTDCPSLRVTVYDGGDRLEPTILQSVIATA